MKFHIIESGSKGNATLIEEGKSLILIDMGIPKNVLVEELKKINRSFLDINAVLFTHNHSDHISGRDFFDNKIIYAGQGTTELINKNVLIPYQNITISNFVITPIQTSHDAINPLGFLIKGKCSSLAYVTDTGYLSDKNIELLRNANYYIIESNHNEKMLLQTNRPVALKQRIMSDVGHLSNTDSAIAMCEMIGPNTKQIFLAHLSEEANDPNVALATYYKIFRKHHINIDEYTITCANQHFDVDGGDL
jgi:phosphoribosyl 1,2-cyclic phosphodiesterase